MNGEDSKDKLKNYLRGVTPNFSENSSYWVFDFAKDDLEKEIDFALEKLLEHNLITGELSPTEEGILICAKGIGVKTYLYFKEYLENKKGKLSNLEIITLLALSEEGKRFFIPFPQFNHTANRYNWNDWKGQYYREMRHLVLEAGEEHKEVYQDIFEEENSSLDLDTEDFLSIKKAVLLYDWMGEKEIKEIEELYKIYGGAIRKLGEGFSWLADSLGGIAEDLGWDEDNKLGSKESVLTEEDRIKKDNLGKIKVLSERLAWGVEEEGLKLARLHIPGLSRNYIRALLREGYDDRKCLEELSEGGLAEVVPERLAGRIKRRFPAENPAVKNDNSDTETSGSRSRTVNTNVQQPTTDSSRTSKPKTKNRELKTVLEIDTHRPDRIIFEGKKIEVTSTEFSLIHLLAQHNEQVMSYDELLEELWKGEKDAIYNRVSFHFSKIRSTILKTIGKSKRNKEKVKDIFKVISRRGIMLNLEEDKLKIN